MFRAVATTRHTGPQSRADLIEIASEEGEPGLMEALDIVACCSVICSLFSGLVHVLDLAFPSCK
jgi:hypothetical protein